MIHEICMIYWKFYWIQAFAKNACSITTVTRPDSHRKRRRRLLLLAACTVESLGTGEQPVRPLPLKNRRTSRALKM